MKNRTLPLKGIGSKLTPSNKTMVYPKTLIEDAIEVWGSN